MGRAGGGMTVLCVASSKGGPGKTLVCQVLSGTLAAEGIRVVVIDADPNAAFSRWAARTYEGAKFEAIAQAEETAVLGLVHEKLQTADLVLIDTGGFGNRTAASALAISDAVVVPSQAGEADVTEAEKTVKLAQSMAKLTGRPAHARVLFNRMKKTKLAQHAASEISAARLPRLDAQLSDLVAYGGVTYAGQVPLPGTAGTEVAALIAELRSLGMLPPAPRAEKANAA